MRVLAAQPLSYLTTDDAALNTLQFVKGTMLANINLQSVFICSQCTQQTNIFRNSNVYIDHCIPSVTYLYQLLNILPDPISRIAQDVSVSYRIHYLDDYLTMGPLYIYHIM